MSIWIVLLSIIACSQSYLSVTEITATAGSIRPTEKRATLQLNTSPATTSQPIPSPVTSPTIIPTTRTPTASLPSPTKNGNGLTRISPTPLTTPKPPILYYTQSGDTLLAVANRFGVSPQGINSNEPVPAPGMIKPGQLLVIPDVLGITVPSTLLLPDSEILNSPSAIEFNVQSFVQQAGGHLSGYKEYLNNGWNSGADIVQRFATQYSINPRILLSLLEYQSNWVYGQPTNLAESDYPMGWVDTNYLGLSKQLSWAVQQLSVGYYGWRKGDLTSIKFLDGSSMRIHPSLNPGTVGLLNLYSKIKPSSRQLSNSLYSPDGFLAVHQKMFDNPWLRARMVEPLFPQGLTQPTLELPLQQGKTWSYTGGPHPVWGNDSPLAAIDFAPFSNDRGCGKNPEWITAMGPGIVVRSDAGIVTVDMDGDGFEQTGWTLFYLHVSTTDRVLTGTLLNTNDKIGHPSCEGGASTGVHVHIARKYNGEWILADGALPFVLSGWRVRNGLEPYEGTLEKDGNIITACSCGTHDTQITRPTNSR